MATTPYDLLKEQFELSQAYAETSFTALTGAGGYLDQIAALLNQAVPVLDDAWISFDWPEPVLDPMVALTRPDPPTGILDIFDDVLIPTEPTLVDPEVPIFPDIPSLSAILPSLITPTAPDPTMPTDPGAAPALNEIVIPEAPVLVFPDEPVLAEIILPTYDGFTMPQFTEDLPVDTVLPLTDQFIYTEAPYQSDVLNAMRAKLLYYLDNDSTGIGTVAEAALWARAVARSQEEMDRAYNEVLNFWSSRGWEFPPGQIDARIQEVTDANLRAMTDINDKITIEQARLIQAQNQETIRSALQYEAQYQQFTSQTAQRTLEAAKAAVEMGIGIFNSEVAYFNLRLDRAKTAASIYETRYRVATLELDAYGKRLEGAKVQSEINAQEVAIYREQLAAIQVHLELYKAQLQGAEMKGNIDKLRLEAFRLVIDIFSQKIAAKTAEYNLYQAQWAGEESKIKLYTGQVQAYATQIEALKTNYDALRTKLAAEGDINKQRLEIYTAQVDRYKADAAVAGQKVDALAKIYTGEVGAYEVDVKAADAVLTAETRIFDGQVQAAKAQVEVLLQGAMANLQAFNSNRGLALEAIKAAANLLAQVAASGLSAANAGIHMGYTDGHSTDETRAVPTTSTSYQYQYSG